MINILMSTYNGEKYLREQLDSIFNQSYQDFVLYVRDDGSSDNTVNVLREYRKQLDDPSKMVIYAGRNAGFCNSFFRLLKKSEGGDYWTFSDQDDVWYKDKLAHAIEWFGKNDDKDIPMLYHSGIEFADENMNVIKKYDIGNYPYCFQKSITSSIFYGFSVMINKKLRDELLKSNPRRVYYHDWYMGMIVAGFGKYCFSDVIDSAHRIHTNNTSAVSIRSKIPMLKKLLTEESFYIKQAMEFKKRYYNELSESDKRVIDMFDMRSDRVRKTLKKVFYGKRWNQRPLEELVIRSMMLIGKI